MIPLPMEGKKLDFQEQEILQIARGVKLIFKYMYCFSNTKIPKNKISRQCVERRLITW